jgi:uncharacterized protein YutE (UPF0331/DUF86 family)
VTVDPALVTRKLLLIASDHDALRPVVAKGLEAYLANRVEQAFVERYLERIVGRMIDVNYHLITGTGQAPPSDYFASFVRLGDMGVLEGAFARAIARAAGLRNRLVHEYEDIDPSRVFSALDEAMRDIPTYLDAVHQYLRRQE